MLQTTFSNAFPLGNEPDTTIQAPGAAIEEAARMVVGRLSLTDAIQVFRNSMVEMALFQQKGSRRAAARLLGVTRPAVQRVLRLMPR